MRTPSLQSLWHGELPPVPERFRRFSTVFVFIFIGAFAFSFPLLSQYVFYLGPGLGDDPSTQPLKHLWQQLGMIGPQSAAGYSLAQLLLAGLLLVNVTATLSFHMSGYLRYERTFGRPYPLRMLYHFVLMNIINSAAITATLAAIASVAWLLGYDFQQAMGWFDAGLDAVRGLANRVPTLVSLPAWLAFLLVMNIGGFFHYWAHRLSHERRLLWLLFHRPHHLTPELVFPTNLPVFFAFPLFLVATPLYVLIFAMISKTITSDVASVTGFIIIYKLLAIFGTAYSHNGALYDYGRQSFFARFMSNLVSEGLQHYMHHSSAPADNSPRGNLVNIGAGMFYLWDRVFGTYRPISEHRPETGLEGRPRLHLNPIRMSLAGVAQLLYELRYNRGLGTWFRILFAGTEYTPPRSYDFALKTPTNRSSAAPVAVPGGQYAG